MSISVRGSIDQISRFGISGWAQDAADPGRKTTASIRCGSKLLAEVACDGFRGDLLAAGIGAGEHAFSCQFEAPIDAASLEDVKVVVDGRELPRSPAIQAHGASLEELDHILEHRLYERSVSYTRQAAISFLPASQTDFGQHPEFHEVFRRWTQKDPGRGLDIARVWSFMLNIKQVLSRTPGALAEVGVYHGQSSALLSFYAQAFDRGLYICDTFSGFDPAQIDAAEVNEAKEAAFRDVDLASVKQVVGDYTGNRWIVGMFPDSVTDEMREDRYAFVSIDCDIYEPIKECLAFFWPRMMPGGMIFVHDYSSGHWPGATRAVDEFCSQMGVAGVALPDLAGSYVLTRQPGG